MPIADIYELRDKSNGGLYAISPEAPNKRGKKMFKVGRTINFRKRLNDYHICFNEGFYIYAILPLNKDKYPMDNETNKKEALQMTIKIESYAFEMLKKFEKRFTTRTFKSEWFQLPKTLLNEFLNLVHEKFPDDTEKPILKWQEPRIHTFEIDGFIENVDYTKMPLTSMVKPGQVSKRSGRVIKSTKDTKFKDMFYLL